MNLVCPKIHDIKLRENKNFMATEEFACIALKSSTPKQKIIDNVIWKTSQPLWHKLNTDGSALGCLGL